MVESRPEDPSSSCCGPHVFTSVLLGVLACVLMTGGVFLAFHRWDPLWLIVSGIGVILVIIGSILHCCRVRQPPVGKGCCLPDHLHNHVVLNGGSLTEQLLPLSNARSVSQLSLNMLPGYFPPVVATYGIEQHSAVVQNINRIIQQQTQSPSTPGSPGKSFILLSLPGNTPQANIQNLVATVYQLDGSVLAETSTATDIPVSASVVTTVSSPVSNSIPVRKNVEVQTCTAWPVPNSANSIANNMPSTSTTHSNTVIMSTQTDDLQPLVAINLMDCSSDPICDNTTSIEVDLPPSATLVNIPSTPSNAESDTSLIDIVDPLIENLLDTSAASSSNVLIDISESPVTPCNNTCDVEVTTTETVSNTASNHYTADVSNNAVNNATECQIAISNNVGENTTNAPCVSPVLPNDLAIPSTSTTTADTESAFQDNSENNSLCIIDVEDCESMGRSSPPPSYEDVALQSEAPVGVFGLAYGTL